MKTRREILAAKAADQRIAELETELEAALERIASLISENGSLRISLDLIARESSKVDKDREALKGQLQVKDGAVQSLQAKHLALACETEKLLRTSKMREEALARAEDRIALLTDLFDQLEAKMALITRENNLSRYYPELVAARNGATAADEIRERQMPLCKRELDTDEWLLTPHKASRG